MNKYKLVIFDFDGTIADTSPGIVNSVRYTQNKMNLPEITLEQAYSHVGPPMEESYNRNFNLTGENLSKAVAYHKEYAITNGYKELEIYNGIVSLVNSLKNMEVKTAIATLKAHQTLIKILESFNLNDKFDIAIGSGEKGLTEKSQLLDYCIKSSGVLREETVLIGDSKYDAIGAKQSGVKFIAVTYGFGFKSESDANEYSNIAVCNSPKEVENYLSSF